MRLSIEQLYDLEAGGDKRRKLLQDGRLFALSVEEVKAERAISKDHLAQAAHYVVVYGLDSREMDLIVIETDFFTDNPATPALKRKYLRDYEIAAEHLTFSGNDAAFDDAGWRLRWGANADSVQTALSGVDVRSTEGILDGRALNLRGVIFNHTHEEIMQQHGLLLRPLGLYPPVAATVS